MGQGCRLARLGPSMQALILVFWLHPVHALHRSVLLSKKPDIPALLPGRSPCCALDVGALLARLPVPPHSVPVLP